MSDLVVVDTSVFTQYLRGDADDALAFLVLKNQVLLSPTVRLEILAGVRKAELKAIKRLCNALIPIESFASLKDCERLLARARSSGLLGGFPDLLVLADAHRFGARLFSYDKKLIKLAHRLGIRLFE